MARIKRSDLDARLAAINTINGTVGFQQYRRHRGNLIPNEGAYMLTNAFGGLALVQMMEQGSIREIFEDQPKPRELHDLMDAYAKGMLAGIEAPLPGVDDARCIDMYTLSTPITQGPPHA